MKNSKKIKTISNLQIQIVKFLLYLGKSFIGRGQLRKLLIVLINYFTNKISGKTFFITGDTGFKGNWMTHFILNFGGEVYGYSNEQKFRKV